MPTLPTNRPPGAVLWGVPDKGRGGTGMYPRPGPVALARRRRAVVLRGRGRLCCKLPKSSFCPEEARVLAAGSSGRPEVRAGLAETAFTHDRNRLSGRRPVNSDSCWCTRVAFGAVRLVALSAPAAVYAEGRKLADHKRDRHSDSRSNGRHQAAIAGRSGVCVQRGGRRCT